jgi:cellobiose transport system permease protein
MRTTPRKIRRSQTEVFVLLGPVVLVFVVFTIVPLLLALYISFFKSTGQGKMEFVGLQNYVILLTEDNNFARSAMATFFIFLVSALPQCLISLGLSIILNNRFIRFKGLFRAVFFMPYVTGGISLALVFMNIFPLLEQYGIANYLMNLAGLKPVSWIGDKETLFITIGIIMNWRFIGWNMILYLASLGSIPESLYESADMEGANFFMKHRHITLPHMVPILFFTFTMSTINSMQAFNEPYMFSGGTLEAGSGPEGMGRPLAVYLIWLMRKANRIDRASAVAWILFIVILLFTLVNRKLLKQVNKD